MHRDPCMLTRQTHWRYITCPCIMIRAHTSIEQGETLAPQDKPAMAEAQQEPGIQRRPVRS